MNLHPLLVESELLLDVVLNALLLEPVRIEVALAVRELLLGLLIFNKLLSGAIASLGLLDEK